MHDMPLAHATGAPPGRPPPSWGGLPPPRFRDPDAPPAWFSFFLFAMVTVAVVLALLSVFNAVRGRGGGPEPSEPAPGPRSDPAWYLQRPTETTPLFATTEPPPPPPPYDGGHHGHHPCPPHDPHPPMQHDPAPPPVSGHSHH